MTARARHQMMLMGTVLIMILISAFLLTMFIPIHISGVKQVIINVGGQQNAIAEAKSSMVVHFSDESIQQIEGQDLFIPLSSLFRLATASSPTPTSMDFKAQVATLNKIDYSTVCKSVAGGKICPKDVLLLVTTDISITVNGQTVYTSPSNGRISAFSQDGVVTQDAVFARWAMNYFQWGTLSYPFSVEGWNPDKYILAAKAGDQLTFKMVGSQLFQVYLIFDLGGGRLGIDATPTAEHTITYDDPTYKYTVPAVTEPDFIPDVTPDNIEIGQNAEGNTRILTLSAQALLGFSSPIQWSIDGLPSGVTYTVSPNPTPAPTAQVTIVSSQLTLAASSSAVLGNCTVTVTGQGGGKSHTATFFINVVEVSGPQNPILISTKIVFTLGDSRYNVFFPMQIKGQLLASTTGAGIEGRTVKVATEFGQGQATTGQDGSFSVWLSPPKAAGTYKIQAQFAGDNTYASANAETVVTVNMIDPNLLWMIVVAIVIILVLVSMYAIILSRRKAGGP